MDFNDCPAILSEVRKAIRLEMSEVMMNGNGLRRIQVDRLLAGQVDVARAIEALEDYKNTSAEVHAIFLRCNT